MEGLNTALYLCNPRQLVCESVQRQVARVCGRVGDWPPVEANGN
jgi:hypothetical protein